MSITKIDKTKNGMQGWKLRPYVADVTGKRKQTSRIFYGTRREAQEEHNRIEQEPVPEKLTFAEALRHFEEYKRVDVEYLADVQNSIRRVSKLEPVISKLTRLRFNAWLLELSRERSPRTCNKIATQIATVIKFSINTGLLHRSRVSSLPNDPASKNETEIVES